MTARNRAIKYHIGFEEHFHKLTGQMKLLCDFKVFTIFGFILLDHYLYLILLRRHNGALTFENITLAMNRNLRIWREKLIKTC